MKILVTGADGFLGRRLCERLTQNEHEIVKFDRTQGDLTNENALRYPDAEGVAGQARHDYGAGVDFVYHLAARTFVPESWKNPHPFYQNNIMGSVTVLEFCRTNKIPLVFLSAYVYGSPKYLPIDEQHPLTAPSPYHMTKLACESLCEFYAERYDMSIRVMRPFNVYGAGQSEEFLIPKIFKQIFERNEIEVFDFSPKRDYIYIDDVINALILAQKPWTGLETFNIGTGVSLSVKEAIEIMLREAGVNKPYRETGQSRNNEIDDCRADISKATAVLGFVPQYSFETGIKKWLEECK
ncbi:MAG: NAD(P)-dependent oxidoreductase [Clostridiales bacterium]|jgi:nucleoside-diphosphate-sugar epimerase|nr:NAD(P)-dependent oxidoreductase [Clostridiales bacterium]